MAEQPNSQANQQPTEEPDVQPLPDRPTVGFIGLGIMGRPMAHNILRAGYSLVVYDLLAEPVAELSAAGATAVGAPATVAETADVVILCLPDSPDVETAITGSQGVLEGTRSGQIIVDMSTISPVTARAVAERCAAKGAILLDAPVSGGQIGAAQGTLSIMVGGDANALEQVRPILETMGQTIIHLGESGAGQVTKACNQIVIAVTIEAVAEAMVLAAKAGVDPGKVRDVLLGGYAYSKVLEGHGARFLARDFAPGFRTRLQVKDLNIGLEAGQAYGAPLPAAALVQQLYGVLMAQGNSELDHAALVQVIEELAGQSIA